MSTESNEYTHFLDNIVTFCLLPLISNRLPVYRSIPSCILNCDQWDPYLIYLQLVIHNSPIPLIVDYINQCTFLQHFCYVCLLQAIDRHTMFTPVIVRIRKVCIVNANSSIVNFAFYLK